MAGKGDKDRTIDKKKFGNNFDEVAFPDDWREKFRQSRKRLDNKPKL